MIADLYVIRKRPDGQKGIFATQFIPIGTIDSFRCKKCKSYSKKELARMPKKQQAFIIAHEVLEPKTGLYTKFCDKRMLYDNHSCDANVMSAHIIGHGLGGVGIVVRDIKKGEEATSDYRLNDGEEVHFEGGCTCGSRDCMKNTTFRPPASKKLQAFWDRKINAALKRVPYVRQPLKKELLAEHPELAYLFKK